jgi:hypothetical protein
VVNQPAVYRLYGLNVDSAIELSDAALTSGRPDVRFRVGAATPTPDVPPPGEGIACRRVGDWVGYTITENEGGYIIRFSDACDMLVSPDLTTVGCTPDPGFDPGMLPLLFVGTVAAFLLAMSGRVVLHASVVRHDGTTVAFMGPSGIGKSTATALSCAAGASLISDDVLALDDGRPPQCVGGWPEVRLRDAAKEIATLFPDDVGRRSTADGRLALQPPVATEPMGPVDVLVVPQTAPGQLEPTVTRLTSRDAGLLVMASGRIEGWRRADLLLREFEMAATLAASVPALVATFPVGPPFSVEAGRAFLDLIAGSRSLT